jgi:hypothetical protein
MTQHLAKESCQGREATGGLCSSRFERMSPVRGFASFQGHQNWPRWWWLSRTCELVGYESWVERDVQMALDADPGVEAVASQPMWLHWVSESAKADPSSITEELRTWSMRDRHPS